ncbi:glycosyltransferase [Treponema zioleckii]|uniref:glycosyltransferase n=1 Tax=Treponema zioleckii TaxID=331680 RepID=UPI00168BF929|nr:glycosyltransferase [Treponema zioleckii]
MHSEKVDDELLEGSQTQTDGESAESESVTNNIFERFPILREKTFYFSNASFQKRHNFLWILKYAELHPDDFFAIQGLSAEDELPDAFLGVKNLSNILLLGKLSEQEQFLLLQKCRAFVNPSFTEGFSMENALALKAGTQIVISNNSATFSIFNETAHYVDPKNPQCELDQVLLDPITSPENFLAKNTFEESAQKLYETLKNSVL